MRKYAVLMFPVMFPVLALLQSCGPTPDVAAVPLSVTNPAAELVTSPPQLYYGNLCPGDSIVRPAIVENIGKDDMAVTRVSVSGAGYSLVSKPALPAILKPGQKLKLSVRFQPGSVRLSAYTGALSIETTDPNNQGPTIPLSGLELPANLQVSPRQLDFGSVATFDSQTLTLSLRNNGACPAQVAGATFRGAQRDLFSTGDLPGDTLQPGDEFNLDVILNCDRSSPLDDSLRFLAPDGRSLGNTLLSGECL